MNNEFTSQAHGPGFQIGNVHGDIVLHGTSVPAESESAAETEPPTDETKFPVRYVVAGVLLLVLVLVITNACGSGQEDPPFPAADQGTRPAGVSDDAVRKVVEEKLGRCADAANLAPSNCPQVHEANSPRNVRWELVGDPRDGMDVRWNNDRFVARGTAVMTVSYEVAARRELAIETFHFRTEIQWRGDDTQIDAIRQPMSAPPPGTIKKTQFTLPDEDLVKAVRDGFTACVSATSSPMPPMCPRTPSTPAMTDATWSIEGNPVGNWATSKDDAEFGLLHVTAGYSLTLRKTSAEWWKSDYDHTHSGNYEATIIKTREGKARLLVIKHVTS